jgi:hypothetical protein
LAGAQAERASIVRVGVKNGMGVGAADFVAMGVLLAFLGWGRVFCRIESKHNTVRYNVKQESQGPSGALAEPSSLR